MISLPDHLKKYIVEQNYERYTPLDQAVWRHCLKRLKSFLSVHAHPSYVDGLEKTGIELEQIPRIENISAKLEKYGWRALPVSGFIPPAAFMELQSLGVLPIASDMRSIDHLLYTPAPDIVHEAAGHAPIIIDSEYADYLREYSQVAKKAILSKEDLDVYSAIRDLSDIKESPLATIEQISHAEKNLERAIAKVSYVSEATQLSRMNWWTAEYGLVGSVEAPKIFGAGLLSSVGESKWCLSDKVKKIPLTVDCIHQSYDITEPQPQLFVTPSFKHLKEVLKQFSKTMAYYVGGNIGLDRAQRAATVTTIQLDSGFQISGVLENYLSDHNQEPIFFKMSGPTQICFSESEIEGHGKNYHSNGYSTPIGAFHVISRTGQLLVNESCRLEFDSGFVVDGKLLQVKNISNETSRILTFEKATVTYKGQVHFQPEWGNFDLLTGLRVISVFGGPADRKHYGHTDDFVAKIIPLPQFTNEQKRIFAVYTRVRELRAKNNISVQEIESIFMDAQKAAADQWLLFFEILEIVVDRKLGTDLSDKIQNHLKTLGAQFAEKAEPIQDALKMLNQNL